LEKVTANEEKLSSTKKTGFLSQRVTEKPGEFSESVQLGLTRNLRIGCTILEPKSIMGNSKNKPTFEPT
jgi:hypothetical protein